METFMVRFAPNVTRGGIFLATRAPRPAGDVFSFEVQLSTGKVALSGQGKVIWVKEFDPAAPQKPHGMGVQFVHLDPGSRETLNQILRNKTAPQPILGDIGRGARNGTGPRAVVDTSIDLAAEYSLDEATLRRAVDHRWLVTGPADAELDALLKDDPPETVTLAQALAELPRLLDPSTSRRRSGAYRSLESTNSGNLPSPPDRNRPAPQTEPSRPVVVDKQAAAEIDPHGPPRSPT
jgi:uncharacterized protein (TIGR02266 family)